MNFTADCSEPRVEREAGIHRMELARVPLNQEHTNAADHDDSASSSLVPVDLWPIPYLLWSVFGPLAINGTFVAIPYFAPTLKQSTFYDQLGGGVAYVALLAGYLPLCIATGRRRFENFIALMLLSPVYYWAGLWLLLIESLFLAGTLYNTYL